MTYVIDQNAEEPIMLLDTHVGYDEEDGQGIDGSLFAKELLFLDSLGKKKIHIWINSFGGNVFEGMKIYSAMMKSNAKVYTHNCGVAVSISAVIFMGGAKKIWSDFALGMFHDAYDPKDSSAKEELDRVNNSIALMIAPKSGKTPEEIRAIMARTTWMNAEEAEQLGFCDEVQRSEDMNKPRMTTNDVKASWKEASNALKTIVNKFSPNTPNMKNVANLLKLNPEASENAIMEEVKGIQNKLTIANAKNEDMENKMKEAEDKYNKMCAEYKDYKDGVAAKEKEVKDAAEIKDMENKTTLATELIEAAVKVGAIKNEATEIKEWKDRAIKDYADTKKIMDKLAGTKEGIDLKKVVDTGKEPLGSVIASTMADIRNEKKI